MSSHLLSSIHGSAALAFIVTHASVAGAQVVSPAAPPVVSKPDSPLTVPQAAPFAIFQPFVRTRADDRWLYVESDGLPHAPLVYPMMVGIRSWQQQVPLPQRYTGNNAWQIPLRPQLAQQPVSGKTQLRRGAIALAANGIPIFNALNNRGEDSFAIGELDEFGGHCGRADDYHYHAAPLALQKLVGEGKPIAYALDGFPIFGLFDSKAKAGSALACPCGSSEKLDEFNGHFVSSDLSKSGSDATRGYHYHASKTYPYINGGMRGQVTVEGDQVSPQPRANPLRPAGAPLRGASITGFREVAANSWSLTYTLQGKKRMVNYSVDADGRCNFEFVDTDGSKKVETYSQGNQGRGQGGGNAPTPTLPHRTTTGDFSVDVPGLVQDSMLSVEYTCDGASSSPPVAWTAPPEGTKSIALVMHHLAPGNDTHVYLVVHGIGAEVRTLPSRSRDIGIWGTNTVNRRAEYAPPCSQGPGVKVYTVTAYALSAAPKFAPDHGPVTRDELLAAIKETTLGTASMDVGYERAGGGQGGPGGPGGKGGQGGRRNPGPGGRGGDRPPRGDGDGGAPPPPPPPPPPSRD